MLFYMNLISIVLAVSLDGFGVGITYGIRTIKITFPALLIIMCCSGSIVLLSMSLGQFMKLFISPTITDKLGGIIFILLGSFVLASHLKSRFKITFFKQHRFTQFTSLLSQPLKADTDSSGTISGGEAVILGFALAMDAFGAGFASAMIGYSPFVMATLIALMSGLFLYSGIKTGFLLSKYQAFEKLTFLPPLLLIGIGVYNLF